jgi:hypothetical protein
MPARTPVDLGREHADCPAQFHGTLSAHVSGCTCPSAAQRRREYDRMYDQSRREGAPPRRQDSDPLAVDAAIDGHLNAGQLTPAERRAVVRHLTTVRHMTDRKIAMHLRWGNDPERGMWAVCRFRRHHRIPAGVAPTSHPPIREAVAA